jgi:hypothetical protein
LVGSVPNSPACDPLLLPRKKKKKNLEGKVTVLTWVRIKKTEKRQGRFLLLLPVTTGEQGQQDSVVWCEGSPGEEALTTALTERRRRATKRKRRPS